MVSIYFSEVNGRKLCCPEYRPSIQNLGGFRVHFLATLGLKLKAKFGTALVAEQQLALSLKVAACNSNALQQTSAINLSASSGSQRKNDVVEKSHCTRTRPVLQRMLEKGVAATIRCVLRFAIGAFGRIKTVHSIFPSAHKRRALTTQ